MSEAIKLKFKGNESFNIREGWLCKGLQCVSEESGVFLKKDATDLLGIGTKMVGSLRFWMQATMLTEELVGKESRRLQYVTKWPGAIIKKYDIYFEDVFSLWILHYHIATNIKLCPAWYMFFNHYSVIDFTKENMVHALENEIDKLFGSNSYSAKMLVDDCSSVIRTYWTPVKESSDPEDNLSCPLAELGLIKTSERIKGGFTKTKASRDKLDKYVVLYGLMNSYKEKESESIDALLDKPKSIGKVFCLDRTLLNEYLDELRMDGWISINRAAGLDMVYFQRSKTPAEVLKLYYAEERTR